MPRFRGSYSDKNKVFGRNVDHRHKNCKENLWKLYKKKYENVLAIYGCHYNSSISTPVRIACHKALGWSRQNQL